MKRGIVRDMHKLWWGLPLVIACQCSSTHSRSLSPGDAGAAGADEGGAAGAVAEAGAAGAMAGDAGASGAAPVGIQCAPHTGVGVKEQGDITTDTVWTAADSPHIVLYSFSIEQGATLTIEPCAEVRIKASVGITVDGALEAEGTATEPISIQADDPTALWSYIRFLGGTGSFAYTSIAGGGKLDANSLGVLDVRNSPPTVDAELLHVDHVSITGSEQYGVSLREGGEFVKGSTALTVTGAKLAPLRVVPELASNIPIGAYTGNGDDEIALASVSDITHDTAFHDRGVPYIVGDVPNVSTSLRVQSGKPGTVAALTIDSNVTIRFGKGGSLVTSFFTGDTPATGALIAVGSADKPIIFTSSAKTPAAGDWVGLWFGLVPDASDKLDHVQVNYAGGPSLAEDFHCDAQGEAQEIEDSAVIITNVPSGQFITNSSITASAGYGIDRGWRGTPIDFAGTNEFHQIAKCVQSYPRSANGGCPTPPIDCTLAP
jgi:hypothetical protein